MGTLAAGDELGPAVPEEGLVVLRNGEVLRGRVLLEADRYRVLLPDGEIRIRAADVEFLSRSLDEAYARKRAAVRPDRPEDHLRLAEWCLKQSLFEPAAVELAAARAVDPRNPRIARLGERLNQLLAQPPPIAVDPNEAIAATHLELDRLVRSLPEGAVESFTTGVQPLLVNSCSAAACHGSQSKSSYKLLRLPANRAASRRLTQRNLQATLPLVDPEQPAESPLLTVPLKPHGTARSPIFSSRDNERYQELVQWVERLTQSSVSTAESPSPSQPIRQAEHTESPAKPVVSHPPVAERPPVHDHRIDPPITRRPAPVDSPGKDPFDPEIFNRLYHSKQSEKRSE